MNAQHMGVLGEKIVLDGGHLGAILHLHDSPANLFSLPLAASPPTIIFVFLSHSSSSA